MSGTTLLYDRDCGFCRWTTAWVLRLDRRRELVPVAIQSPRGAELLADMEPVERLASAHVVTAAGERSSAGAIAGPLFRAIPGASALAILTGRFPRATERAYRFVAEHRSAFGRPLTAAAKRRADAVIAHRAR